MEKSKLGKKIKSVLGTGLVVILIYIMANFMGGNVYVGVYSKGLDERVEKSFESLNLTDSYKGHMGQPVKFKGNIIKKVEDEKEVYVLQTNALKSEDSLMIVKNESSLAINEGDTLEINGFYAGKKVIKVNDVKTKLPVIDTLVAEKIDNEELSNLSMSEIRTYESELSIKRVGNRPNTFIHMNWIENYPKNSLMEFQVHKSGDGMSTIKDLKIEKYEGEKLLETQKMELLNYEITSETYLSNLVTVRCDSKVTQAKIILEYTDDGDEEIQHDIIEVKIPSR